MPEVTKKEQLARCKIADDVIDACALELEDFRNKQGYATNAFKVEECRLIVLTRKELIQKIREKINKKRDKTRFRKEDN